MSFGKLSLQADSEGHFVFQLQVDSKCHFDSEACYLISGLLCYRCKLTRIVTAFSHLSAVDVNSWFCLWFEVFFRFLCYDFVVWQGKLFSHRFAAVRSDGPTGCLRCELRADVLLP